MRLNDLKVSNVNISEVDYGYRGVFTLTGGSEVISTEISELENKEVLAQICKLFELSESGDEVKKTIIDLVYEQSALDSGAAGTGADHQEESKVQSADHISGSLDMA